MGPGGETTGWIQGSNGGKLRPFQKGQSVNPGGKPKDPKEKALVRAELAKLSLTATKRLAAIINGEIDAEPRDVIRAAEVIFNRVYGMPKQEVEQQTAMQIQVITGADVDKYAQ